MAGRSLESPGWLRWFGWSVGLAVLVQLGLFVLATAPGLAGTADSRYYVHAAGTLRAAGVLLHPDGSAYRYWPPLYSVLVALGGSLGVVRVLHGLALVAGLLAWSRLGRWLLPGALALAFPWVLALSTPWLVVSKFVWGEAVFVALVAGYALALFRWLHTQHARWWGLATALGFVLPLHRTPGFFLLAGVGVGLVLQARALLPKQRLLAVAHLALSAVGGLAWHYYSLLLAAPSVYRYNKGWAQFFSSCADYGFVLSRWLLPVRASWRPEMPLLWALALVGVLVLLLPRGSTTWPQSAFTKQDSAGDWRTRFPRVLWAATGFFILQLIITTTFTRSAAGLYDGERYTSVLFGPVMLLALLGIGRWAAHSGSRDRFSWLVVGLVGMWLAYGAGRTISNAMALRKLPPFEWTAAR
ncbi:hypothetical protein [Hymenobacter arizonensis]|uniref:Dolichyl-phosphate-mannose-protein mannosyltransferase n=1 Tax=Hymenobacter arizonensis TaxID=1227077 RepID=A0A1I5Z9S0_HYMAR|nr:hypothetical protein [Hymenobacter arizonensis]SFQ53115.1 hypothetical protein SAMN04515668_2851 [Hymenobacter arizonensis]